MLKVAAKTLSTSTECLAREFKRYLETSFFFHQPSSSSLQSRHFYHLTHSTSTIHLENNTILSAQPSQNRRYTLIKPSSYHTGKNDQRSDKNNDSNRRKNSFTDFGKHTLYLTSTIGIASLWGIEYVHLASSNSQNIEYQQITWNSLQERLIEGGNILDLSEIELDEITIEKLKTWLSTEQHRFMRIIWGPNLPENSSNVLESISEILRRNQDTFQERPSPYICVRFCQLAYSTEKALNENDILPKGWKVLKTQGSAKDDGYFGVAFINHSTGHIILSHRGTQFTSSFNLLTDALGVVGGTVEKHQESAIKFTYDVLRESEKRGYRLGIVGHSLGGWLAQLTTSLCVSKGFEDVYAVTLDTPGAKEMMDRYFANLHISPMLKIDENRLDITNYLSLPNLINTCKPHIGNVLHIVPKAEHSIFLSVLSYWDPIMAYSLKTHSHSSQIAAFDSKSEAPERLYEVITWPEIKRMGKDYYRFFILASENQALFPLTEHLQPMDKYLVEHIASYKVTEAEKNKISLRYFSNTSLQWLKNINSKQEDLKYLKGLEAKLGLSSKELQNLPKFEIDFEKNALYLLEPTANATQFKSRIAMLIKTYPELIPLSMAPPLELSFRETSILLKNRTKELIHFCENVIPVRLYLFDPATVVEIKKHEKDKSSFAKQIEQIQAIQTTLSKKKTTPTVMFWIKITENQIDKLNIMQSITQAFIDYKSQEFEKAQVQTNGVLKSLEEYEKKSSDSQLPRLKASIYSLKAKIDRSVWKEEKDLKNSEKNYLDTLDEKKGLPDIASLWSNYGSLLNNWGEWLFWEGRINEALEKHQLALENHKKAHELSLLGDWLFQDENISYKPHEGIKRDYGRTLYLIAKLKYDTVSLDPLAYHKQLEEALTLLSTEGRLVVHAVDYLFEGIIYEEMGDIPKASKCYNLGLEKSPNHLTLLNRRAGIYESEGNLKAALNDLEKSRAGYNEKRGKLGLTAEDQYRLKTIESNINRIKEKLASKEDKKK